MIAAAESGSTVRLGHLLAPAGVRYIALVARAAPSSGAAGRAEPGITDALGRQLDLTLSRVDTSGAVYDNDAWVPMHAIVPPADASMQIDNSDPAAAAVRSEPDGVPGVAATAGTTDAAGPGTLLWSEAASSRWVATANGTGLDRRDAFGWTNAFALPTSARVHVRYAGRGLAPVERFAEIAIWIALVVVWFATRRRRVEAREREARAAAPLTDPPPVDPPAFESSVHV